KVLYLTAEKFMYGFVAALRAQNALAFKEALRTIDVLVIDDLQFLQGRSTQAEFCHTLNALIDAGRQVVIAADRPPSDLERLHERVRSRLAGGLVVEMGSLGEELRLEILKCRAAAARQHHPCFDVPAPVLEFIAKTVTHNGRDLEGALNRLLAHSKLTGQPVTLEMAEREVRDLIRPQEPKRVKIEDIQRVVARQYNVSRADLLSSRRTANVVRPRQVAMYLAKTLTLRSLPEIGRRFGGRDHTTVLHAVRKIENLVSTDTALAEEIELLKRQLQEGASPGGWGAAGNTCKAKAVGRRGEADCRFDELPCRRACPTVPGGQTARNRGQIRWVTAGVRRHRPCEKRRHAPPSLPLWGLSTRAGGLKNESHRRTRSAVEVARPCPSRGRAAQHHSDPRQRVDQGGEIEAHLQGDRPRCRGHRNDLRRGRPRRLDHGAGTHVLRDRAQAPRGCAGRDRSLWRPRGAGDPRRPLPLHLADAARERLSRSRGGRDDAHVQARGRRPQAADRQDPIRDLDRGDALLSQRHLSAHRRRRQGAHAARSRDRRASPGAVRAAA